MSLKFQVATGIISFRDVVALSPREAIRQVRKTISDRRHVRKHPTIGMSLVEALDSGKLHFLVFDADRTLPLAGEFNGVYQEPLSLELVRAMQYHHLSQEQLHNLLNK